jgi:dTDP-glucose 4,6-dehydratase
VRDRPGHDRRYSISSKKTKQLGWINRTDFEQALDETIKWYVDNPKWWQRLKDHKFNEFYRLHYGN